MDKKYEKSLHIVGRLGLLIGISFMLGIPAFDGAKVRAQLGID